MGFEFATTEWPRLLGHEDIHILHVCTPNHLYKGQVLAALAAGKHVYCDKPLCVSRQEADEIAAALPVAGVSHQMVLHNRFFPAILRAKALVEEGFCGEIVGLRAAYPHAGSVDPRAPLKWRLDASRAGGGVLLDLGSHVLDLVQHLVGPVRAVSCATHIAYPERPAAGETGRTAAVRTEDAVVMTVRAGGGAIRCCRERSATQPWLRRQPVSRAAASGRSALRGRQERRPGRSPPRGARPRR